MISKQYRNQLAETTDDHLRYEFLRLLAQEGRQHFMRQIAEETISDPSGPTTAPPLSH
jgi:F0F1-type ATP synthase delta subunit